jgi:hypothetical protein
LVGTTPYRTNAICCCSGKGDKTSKVNVTVGVGVAVVISVFRQCKRSLSESTNLLELPVINSSKLDRNSEKLFPCQNSFRNNAMYDGQEG